VSVSGLAGVISSPTFGTSVSMHSVLWTLGGLKSWRWQSGTGCVDALGSVGLRWSSAGAGSRNSVRRCAQFPGPSAVVMGSGVISLGP
jgi:hypothetical protein